MDYLHRSLLGNTVLSWGSAVLVTILAFVAFRLLAVTAAARLARFAKHTRTEWDDIVAAALSRTKALLLFLLSAYAGSTILTIGPGLRRGLRDVAVVALLLQTGLWLSSGIRRWVAIQRKDRPPEEAATVMTMNVFGVAARLVLWSMVVILSLDTLGVNVSALVAGLGVGGVAVALAAQSVLADLFASLSIVFDRPFVLGDFLIVGDLLGSVEEIGLKTTRLRSLSGEQLVFSNTDLLGSRIRNYGRMYERRVVFSVGVTYQTPREKLEHIPVIIREAILKQGDRVRFDRAHLQSFGDFAIVFESVYYVLVADYTAYMDVQQDIYLTIHERFEAESIEFAYPTQTLFLEKQVSE
ncbi:MAG: mechanosensitive ion channel family protein [Gemmatimonadetes bacterium]|nr:mechanosensitive ion channel family protein [Gemmatimonadota bacterium]